MPGGTGLSRSTMGRDRQVVSELSYLRVRLAAHAALGGEAVGLRSVAKCVGGITADAKGCGENEAVTRWLFRDERVRLSEEALRPLRRLEGVKQGKPGKCSPSPLGHPWCSSTPIDRIVDFRRHCGLRKLVHCMGKDKGLDSYLWTAERGLS